MTIPFIPTNLFPFATRPYDNVQPFTLRDSATMLNTIDGIRRWIQHDLIPHLDTEQSELVKSWSENIEQINTSVVNALATNNADVSEIVLEQNSRLAEFVTETNALVATMNGQVASASESADAALDSQNAASVSASAAGTSAAAAAASADRAQTAAAFIVRAIPELYPSIDNTGVADTAPALTTLCAAIPVGSTVQFVGTYRLATEWRVPAEKKLTLDFTSSSILIDGTAYTSISCTGGYGAVKAVADLTVAPVQLDGGSRTVAVLTVPSSGYKRGDIVKVFSDDLIPGAHITSVSDLPRVGEFAIVYDSDATTVTLSGPLVEKYTSNIRIARLNDGTVNVINLDAQTTDTRLNADVSGVVFAFRDLIRPQVTSPRLRRMSSIGLQFNSCYGYAVEDPYSEYGTNKPSATGSANLAYLVHDSGSNDGYIKGGLVIGGRHAFTDGASLISAGDTSPQNYGATIGARWIGGTAKYMKAAGFDTHHMTKGVQFIDCTVHCHDEMSAFTLRGREAMVINPTVYGGKCVVEVATQVTAIEGERWSRGESYGHRLVNAKSFGTRAVYQGDVRREPSHPFADVTYAVRNIIIEGGTFIDVDTFGSFQNGYVELVGTQRLVLKSAPAANLLFALNNSRLEFADVKIDARQVTTLTTAARLISMPDTIGTAPNGSYVDGNRVEVQGSTVYATAVTTYIAGQLNTKRVHINSAVLDVPTLPARVIGLDALGSVDLAVSWRSPQVKRSSSNVVLTNDEIINIPLEKFGSSDELIFMTVQNNDATPRTLATLPAGKYTGQRLSIMGIGTVAVTVKNGAIGNTSLAGGTDKLLSATGQAIDLVWSSNIWRQLFA